MRTALNAVRRMAAPGVVTLPLMLSAAAAAAGMVAVVASGSASSGQARLTAVLLAETLVLVVAWPLLSHAAEAKGTLSTRQLAARGVLQSALFAGASLAISGALIATGGGVTAGALLRAHALLLIAGLALTGIASVVRTVAADVIDASGATFVLTVLLLGGVLMISPLVGQMPEALQAGVMMANPAIAVSSVLGFDVLRTEPLYRISAIPRRRFEYPAFGRTVLSYLVIAAACFSMLAYRERRQPGVSLENPGG